MGSCILMRIKNSHDSLHARVVMNNMMESDITFSISIEFPKLSRSSHNRINTQSRSKLASRPANRPYLTVWQGLN